jgi:hypothetical protein
MYVPQYSLSSVYPEELYAKDTSSNTLDVVALPNNQRSTTQHKPSNNISDLISQTIFDSSSDTVEIPVYLHTPTILHDRYVMPSGIMASGSMTAPDGFAVQHRYSPSARMAIYRKPSGCCNSFMTSDSPFD